MVVDACFIASQIDVWTQAYNGPTSRRKYVLNLLNVLHKNVTEEYKTDQFLHVIYWFLIYKSNLGHFFRNEGIFSPPPLPPPLLPPISPCTDLAHWSGACRCCTLQSVPTRMPMHGTCSCSAAHMCTRRCVRKLQTLGRRYGVIFDPAMWCPPFEAKNWDRGLIRELFLACGISQI